MKVVKFFIVFVLAVSVLFVSTPRLYADETSELILKLLIKKGILTRREVDDLKAEVVKTKPEVPRNLEDRVAKLEESQFEFPQWIQNIKLKGDLRLRYEWNKRQGNDQVHRGRFRYRLGIESQINDKVTVAAGIASGGDNARSTNQDFENVFTTKALDLDYAYAQYSPKDWVTLYGGKMQRKPILWEPGDLLWDTDITPEGGAITLQTARGDFDLFMNSGIYVLDEATTDTSDPFMYYTQPGVTWKATDNTSVKFATTFYGFSNVKGATLDGSTGTNSIKDGVLKFDYDAISPAAEIGVNEPIGGLVPYAALFGEYVNAIGHGTEDWGYLLGLKFGDKKVKKFGDWQAKYMYAHLERDAWLDNLPDADRFSGRTHIEGHEFIFDYGLAKNVSLGLDYYFNRRLEMIDNDQPQHLLQVDVNFKF